MKTEWLEWLVLFKKYKSLQKVSDVCHVTPQNIGKMFGHLEDELGVQLFEKKGKTIYLTAAGRELADTAEKITNSLEQFKDKYTNTQNAIIGELELLSTDSLIMQDVLNSFLKRFPAVKISYMDVSFREALDYVKENKNVIAFVPIWQNEAFYTLLKKYEPYCNIHMLFKDENRIFMSKEADLAKRKVITIGDLQGKKIVSYIKNGRPEDAKEVFYRLISKDSASDLDIIGTNSIHYFQTVVKNNLALGMGLYSNFKQLEEEKNICSVKIDGEGVAACIWSLIYNVNKKISVCDKLFISALEQYCTQLTK
ncbi:MAG: LysR family transcriptional regulator [Peptococcaceae bacterium]|nr:LysR family transcriptional regulator [Peptococcaceae bacterium]MBO5115035.1 LysR family transcriptional regulator [Peptococcaceae bacterium]MBO5140009.1 LysR family transcriptional regulator [Peptococcaceae bacterium]MBO5301799.1 LysR family transcriptional regulator [Peptococcaceae bacterium]MBO5365943.1 LysR family transcriptional regulator [Peptococcaceae bacterium]